MKHSLLIVFLFVASFAIGQTSYKVPEFYQIKKLEATPVKDQAMTGTCWCFSTTSLLESDELRSQKKEFDLSEMFVVRNIYIEKARNYILRGGKAQFGEGGLSHDMIRATALYGAVPESEYSGLVNGEQKYNHSKLYAELQQYLDNVLKKQPIAADWMDAYVKILDQYLGVPPAEFSYNGKKYTPFTFAKEVLKFNAKDYISLTSFTHVPYYEPFILQVPDNFSNGSFYNLPLNQLLEVIKTAVEKSYTVAWDADVSNKGFMQGLGLALNFDNTTSYKKEEVNPDVKEAEYNAIIRQQLYENLTTQDDHLMHIVGVEKSKDGKTFFIVKNSWGKIGPFEGYIHVSEAYMAINTISIVVPKAALSKEMWVKLKL